MSVIKVIIPVYKTEKYLERCVNSILLQSEQNFEIVLIDDGSPDRCPEICDRLAEADPRIHVLHQTNQGLSAARNAGIEYVLDCEYITFVDSDDWVHSQYLEVLLNAIEETGCVLAVGGHVKTNGAVPLIDKKNFLPSVYSAEESYCLTSISTTPAWGKIYKTDLFQNIRFPVGKIHEDYYVTWKTLFRAENVAVIKAPLYYYYQNTEGIMHSTWSVRRMDFFPAMEEKIQFFQEQKLENAEKRAVKKLMKTLDKYIVNSEKENSTRDYTPKLLQMKEEYGKKYHEILSNMIE